MTLHLELRKGRWYPENDGGPYRDVYAFADASQALQYPGPLIRVTQGAKLHVTVRNSLPERVVVHGLHGHADGADAALHLEPGDTRELQFVASEPGTFLYWASTSDGPITDRRAVATGLSGAYIVDPPGRRFEDRIFVVGLWEDPADFQQVATINGKSWPYTEHLDYRAGSPIRWRIINGTFDPHAMHLHGFFFTVEGEGDGERFQYYAGDRRREAATELINPGHVFDMSWTPDRTGNWLFHCHMLSHMSLPEALHPKDAAVAEHKEHEAGAGMGGLVLGIKILPATHAVASKSAPSIAVDPVRRLQLLIRETDGQVPQFRMEVRDLLETQPDQASSAGLLGPPIVLRRGQSTEIEVKNLTSTPTAIHWHGIELESYYDGVPGWTGTERLTTPAILPGASFVARMTPPRAGTFIYHTHWHDDRQLENGMYGPLIVLEPGVSYDPEHDRTFVISTGNYAPFGEMLLINGSPEPGSEKVLAGVRYRWRFINITTDESDVRVKLLSEEIPAQWRIIAKDAVDFPVAQQTMAPAEMPVTVGSTTDVEYLSDHEGYGEIQVSARLFKALVMQPIDVIASP